MMTAEEQKAYDAMVLAFMDKHKGALRRLVNRLRGKR